MSIATNEFAVIAKVAEELSALDKGGIRRALNWLADYYDTYEEDEAAPVAAAVVVDTWDDAPAYEDEAEADDFDEDEAAAPDTFATFYELIAPKTAIQKAVTAAYWLQTKEGVEAWKSFEVNKLLRQNGIKLSSISGTLAIDEKKDEPMVQQLSRSGDSMQSRKTFELTDAGVAFVEGRM